MATQGLVGVHARRRWRRGRPDVAPTPDLVNRRFNPAGPDRVWAADVTQLRTGERWLYLLPPEKVLVRGLAFSGGMGDDGLDP